MSAPGELVQPVPGVPVEIYAPPSREQLFWARHLAWLLAPAGRPSWLARAWGVIAVAPYAHITFFSLSYQAYLYDVFHQTKTSRFWHQLCMPLVNLMIMAALAPITIAGVDGGAIYALLLLGWYLAQALASRLVLWGLLMIPLVGALYLAAGLYVRATATIGWAGSPLLWMVLLPFVQALSHVAEPRLPPRVTAGPRWRTIAEFLAGDPADGATGARSRSARARLVRLVRLAAQALWGTIAEFWASPRLFPYGVLAQLRRFGYARNRLTTLDDMIQRAIASGQPAIDFIGSGGGAFLRAPAARGSAPQGDGPVSPASSSTLSRRWRGIFALEIPLTLGACTYWAFAAGAHLEASFGPGAASGPSRALLAQLTAVVFSLVVWFYGRWLFSPAIALRPFRYLQEGFAIGDIALVVMAVHQLRQGVGTPAVWIAQTVMAALWLAVRIVFLATHR